MVNKIKDLLKKHKIIFNITLKLYNIPKNLITLFIMAYYLPLFSFRGLQPKKIEKNLIISFTSYPKRISCCPYVVESIFAQKVHPEKIILWLSLEDFKSLTELPLSLRRQLKKGLEIKFIPKDLGPHTKYYYAMSYYSNKTVITIDDDIIYPKDTIGDLVKRYNKTNKRFIVSSLARRINTNNSIIRPYISWKHNFDSSNPTHKNIALGVYGVLYPPKSLFKDWSNKNLILNISPNSDDLWLKFMELIQDTMVISLNKNPKKFRSILFSQKNNLSSENVTNNRNDVFVNNIVSHYKNICFTKIIGE